MTTLLHVLAGLITPDDGTVQRAGTIGLARQELPARDGATVGTLTSEALTEGDPSAEDRYAQARARRSHYQRRLGRLA
ncbi:hypothetical protein [Micromonospora sp. NPDC049645]|uniref:hypothetical protein n=1 Tax=Micromonospora sp. NPDC049645 TaxID=3155508 RepID=UPI0034268D9C